MIVRPETAADVDPVRQVIAAAFAEVDRARSSVDSAGTPVEVDLVERLRADEGWIPELALVACIDDQIVGHCVTTRAQVDGSPVLGLGPISVLPRCQRQGVGRALIRRTIITAHAAGERLICLLGNPDLYSKFAFFDAAGVGVNPPDPTWGAHFQALVLDPEHPRGTFSYAEPFNRL